MIRYAKHGGKKCNGPAKQVVQCNNYPCPGKDLSWFYGREKWQNMKWYHYKLISKPCRWACTKRCSAAGSSAMLYSYVISVDCVWTDFKYTDCSSTCGGGTRVGRRSILRPATYGGQNCYGPSEVTEDCNNYPCPGNTLWNVNIWREWSKYFVQQTLLIGLQWKVQWSRLFSQ